MIDFERQILGETDSVLELESSEDNQQATIRMLQQANRSLLIASREMDPAVYDVPEVIEAFKQMILNNRRMKIRVVVFEPQKIAQRGHQILRLAGDLSSFIDIRRGGRQHEHYAESMLVADDSGYIHRQQWDRFDGRANFSDRRRARSLIADFETMWTAAVQDSNLRRLRI